MRRVGAATRSVALGGPWHGKLIESRSEELSVRDTIYRRVRVWSEGQAVHLYIWEGLDTDEAKVLISEWTR